MLVACFENSVFINCPFDADYQPLLQAMAFCIIYLGFFPRLAPEDADNANPRLNRILDLIRNSKYGIHDLSRCKSDAVGEFARMNMPFELGIDHGCSRFGSRLLQEKAILVLETNKWDYQKALSDISGWDIQPHGGDFIKIIRAVRNWLVAKAGAPKIGPSEIQGKYAAFQEWYWERELRRGSSEEDILEYPTNELLDAMIEWMDAGQPT